MARKPDNALCFVQFMHPGGEHRPDDGCFKSWNRGKHKRKFLVSPGRCIRSHSDAPTADRWDVKKGEVVFWGEWEPESEVVCRVARPKPGYPRYLYRPFYEVPGSYKGLQNTDPFVFGGFFYGNCRQHKNGKPTQLCFLERGSVILFGSCLSSKFVLDTVFVVRDSIPYDCASYQSVLKDCVPRSCMEVVLNPLCQSGCGHKDGCPPDKGAAYRLYRGATYTDRHRFDGMFSFFPCMPRDKRCESFRRPTINGLGLIPDKPPLAYRLNRQADPAKVRRLWECVVDRVLGEGLWLGIHAQMPERRPAKR